MRKSQSQQSKLGNFVRIMSKHSRVIIFGTIFGFLGIYGLFYAQASSGGFVYFDNSQTSQVHLAGESYNLTLFADVPSGPRTQMQLWVSLASDHNLARYVEYTCGAAGECNDGADYTDGGSERQKDLDVCVNISPTNVGTQHVSVLTVKYQALQAGNHQWQPLAIWHTGSCGTTGDDISSQGIKGQNGPIGAGAGTRVGVDKGDNGTGPIGTGEGPGASGGSGGGSSANTQSQQPNSIPSSTAQGDSTQPDLEPSPFFDGKQYEPGSDPDILGVNTTFSVAGHNLKYGWLFVLGIILAGTASGYFFWRRDHRSRK